jgi:hypothetical protein
MIGLVAGYVTCMRLSSNGFTPTLVSKPLKVFLHCRTRTFERGPGSISRRKGLFGPSATYVLIGDLDQSSVLSDP